MKVDSQKIVPALRFDGQAREAVEFYTSIFGNSSIHNTSYFTTAGQEIHQNKPGAVMSIEFQLNGFRMLALNGGPHFRFNPSISFFVMDEDREEIKRIWTQLLEEGKELMPLDSYEWSDSYGWVQDRFGLSWQLMLDPHAPVDRIVPLLFFTGQQHGKAEDALRYYTAVFEEADIQGVLYYGEGNSYATGFVKHAQFQLAGQAFMAMDSGKENDFPFNEAVSFIVNCKSQEEIDLYWNRLATEGDPAAQQCGWIRDKFGIFWQILPQEMFSLFRDPDKDKANRAMVAMLNMKKINIEILQNAFEGS